MADFESLPSLTKCFCQIPVEKIEQWAKERYINKRATVDLLCSTTNAEDRHAITAVALLDVEESTLIKMMGDINMPDHHMLHCREKAKKIVDEITKGASTHDSEIAVAV